MNALMSDILARKAHARKELARLSFTEKIEILERIRRRNKAVAAATLRKAYSQPSAIVTVASGGAVHVSHIGVLKPRVYLRLRGQSSADPQTITASPRSEPLGV